MAQTDDLGTKVIFERKPRTHKLGKSEYTLDDAVVDDPAWYTYEDAAKDIGLSVSYIKAKSGELNWPKKYAMVRGTMLTFVERIVVKKFNESRNPLELESKTQDAEFKPAGQAESPKPNETQNGQENAGAGGEKVPALNQPTLSLQMIDERVGQLIKTSFKEELKNIQEGVDRSRKENTFWKIFALVTVVVLMAGTSLIVLNFNKINKVILDMSSDLIKQKEEVFKSEATIKEKDFEIKFLQDQIGKNTGAAKPEVDLNKEGK